MFVFLFERPSVRQVTIVMFIAEAISHGSAQQVHIGITGSEEKTYIKNPIRFYRVEVQLKSQVRWCCRAVQAFK